MENTYRKKRLFILLFKSWKALGLIKGTALLFKYFVLRVETYSISGFRHQIHLRPGSTDLDVLLQFISDRHYEIAYPGDQKFILDGGANIGLASVFFANKFPDATIVAIEPDPGNYATLLKNIEPYLQIRSLNAGLWSKSAWLNIENRSEGEWALMVTESAEPADVMAYSVADIIQRMEIPYFDIVKLDIEGSEKEVFEGGDLKWVDKVSVLIVEFHDHMRVGGAHTVLSKVVQRPFSMLLKDENLVFVFN
jgi:FkbM family methyltransferase